MLCNIYMELVNYGIEGFTFEIWFLREGESGGNGERWSGNTVIIPPPHSVNEQKEIEVWGKKLGGPTGQLWVPLPTLLTSC